MLRILNKVERMEILGALETRFGWKQAIFDDFGFLQSSDKIWICSKECLEHDIKGLKIETIGLLFARQGFQRDVKPTTNIVQLFGKHTTTNVIELTDEQTYTFLHGLDIAGIQADASDGYVIIRRGEDYLGVGILRQGKLKSQVPKARRIKKF